MVNLMKNIENMDFTVRTGNAADFIHDVRLYLLKHPDGIKKIINDRYKEDTAFFSNKGLNNQITKQFDIHGRAILELLFNFEKTCTMNNIEIPESLRSAIYTQLISELKANEEAAQNWNLKCAQNTDFSDFCVTAVTLSNFTLFHGDYFETLTKNPKYRDLAQHIPQIFYHATARIPMHPELRLDNILDQAQSIIEDNKLEHIKGYPWIAYWSVFYATEKNHAANIARNMDKKIEIYQELWLDDRFMMKDMKYRVLHDAKYNSHNDIVFGHFTQRDDILDDTIWHEPYFRCGDLVKTNNVLPDDLKEISKRLEQQRREEGKPQKSRGEMIERQYTRPLSTYDWE